MATALPNGLLRFKPYTEVMRWAKAHGYTAEDVIRFQWYQMAQYYKELSVEELFLELVARDGIIGLPISRVPQHINQTMEAAPHEIPRYEQEEWRESFKDFVRHYPIKPVEEK